MKETEKFRIGDKVSLMSEHRSMTVLGYEGNKVLCTWLNKSEESEKECYPEEALMLAENKPQKHIGKWIKELLKFAMLLFS